MELITLKEMLFYKHLSGLSCDEISKRSGVPLSTVQKVFSMTTSTPRNKTLLALGKAFEEFSKDKVFLADSAYEKSFYNSVDKTIDDYLALPEGARVELIDGVFYDMAAPNYLHTQIASQIWKQLDDYIYSNKGKCSAAIAPTDVQLDRDNKTIVQPDLLVTCNKDKINP